MGNPDTRELAALKRVGAVRGLTTFSLVVSPVEVGRMFYTLYIMSDSYQGLDQYYHLTLRVQDGAGEIYYCNVE